MKKITCEQIPFLDDQLEQYLTELENCISIYSNRELKEYLEALLLLDIDILNDNTYCDQKIGRLMEVEVINKLINFNVYGSIRKFLLGVDEHILWPKGGYNERRTFYSVWYDKESVLALQFPSNITGNDKITISLNVIQESQRIRHEQIDKLIESIYKKSKDAPKWFYEQLHYYQLGCMVKPLSEWFSRVQMSPVQIHLQKNFREIYELFEQRYGLFTEDEEVINVEDTNIIGISKVKETSVAVFQKRKTYY